MEILGHLIYHGLKAIVEAINEEDKRQRSARDAGLIKREVEYGQSLEKDHLTTSFTRTFVYGRVKEGDDQSRTAFLAELCMKLIENNWEARFRTCGDPSCPCHGKISPGQLSWNLRGRLV